MDCHEKTEAAEYEHAVWQDSCDDPGWDVCDKHNAVYEADHECPECAMHTRMKDMNTVIFDRWWREEGSGITPDPEHDMSEHAHRIALIAWSNGEYLAAHVMGGGIKELTEQIHIRDKMISALQGDGEYEIRYLTWRAPALLLVAFVGFAFLLSRLL